MSTVALYAIFNSARANSPPAAIGAAPRSAARGRTGVPKFVDWYMNGEWGELPDPTFIHKVAFDGIDDADIAIAVRVLQTATEHLVDAVQAVHISGPACR